MYGLLTNNYLFSQLNTIYEKLYSTFRNHEVQ
jgi:hypothetical protein